MRRSSAGTQATRRPVARRIRSTSAATPSPCCRSKTTAAPGTSDTSAGPSTAQLIHRLAQVPAVSVVASARADEAQSPDARDGHPIHAALVVTGSVRPAGERVVVTTQIVDSFRGSYLASQSEETALSEEADTVAAIADALVARIEPALQASRVERAGRRSENLAAHNLYLAGQVPLEPANGRRPAQGRRAVPESDGRGSAVRRRPQRDRRCERPAVPLRRRASGGRLDARRVERGDGHHARRRFGRSPHLARPREGDAGLGLRGRGARVSTGLSP